MSGMAVVLFLADNDHARAEIEFEAAWASASSFVTAAIDHGLRAAGNRMWDVDDWSVDPHARVLSRSRLVAVRTADGEISRVTEVERLILAEDALRGSVSHLELEWRVADLLVRSGGPVAVSDITVLCAAAGMSAPMVSTVSMGRVRKDHDQPLLSRWFAEGGVGSTTSQVGTAVTAAGATALVEERIEFARRLFRESLRRHPVLAPLADAAWSAPRIEVWATGAELLAVEPVWGSWITTVDGLVELGWGRRGAVRYADGRHEAKSTDRCSVCSLTRERHRFGAQLDHEYAEHA